MKILILDEESKRRASFRTVVWRVGEDEPRCLVLRPLEEYADTRRLDDYPEAIDQTGEDRFY